uniref:Uncharacterized protein n=1 Tax=Aureoumbra lagunensis TaxID=44058 RepID=A0A7S3NPN3_9STRA|mmetsp:Transcript_2041/g.2692  ORF Transcript_2041/g.2692 Transcript_2041/m.2692 type:complete len:178 (-) Transcript_2041:273-806(-)|eukprot:CAMPEP_0197286168 /NCGR_PEP_ID=MMETSP0890-20130614/1654_1 /TAXON_ID=44058 ORGANISM="Aureoumbra lagunensis, Strain CCMP1510" /NCGR_SAMPLE_ID=MMETSP0890 /ASSEMBLY_ACC=CAM_ASM_000533 /LENGTH=177 /DNA_ID=CAMNT_0042754361 /DNA_START=72 /DNA_END=605 /DNA_ORIENTATION=+
MSGSREIEEDNTPSGTVETPAKEKEVLNEEGREVEREENGVEGQSSFTKNDPSSSLDSDTNGTGSDIDEKVMQLRSRIIGVMLKNKHRQDAAGLAKAAKEKSLAKYLSEDLSNIGVYQPERRKSLELELGRHYEDYILPIVSNNLDTSVRPPSIHERPRRQSFLSWLFGTCAMASGT